MNFQVASENGACGTVENPAHALEPPERQEVTGSFGSLEGSNYSPNESAVIR
ncbi:hypothetical protein K0M31_000573 [Melipona bicolor]|uniref:Uncharacterized protein n=1 Tax=Melipona bicolor TaxID=60889 RepID=A0AA40GE08_9HYME|nr:hypothetical protein K0M31_000573 [Melipona bicolor]